MLISHLEEAGFHLETRMELLKNSTDDSQMIEEKVVLLKALSQFPLGRFLLTHRGLNGFWTSYLILKGIREAVCNPLESWILHDSPAVKATRERFYIFQKQVQQRLESDMKLASLPCGLMDDLLTLNYAGLSNINLTGIDLDPASIKLAEENAKSLGINFAKFIQKDAWQLNISNDFHLIVSNGLNIYETCPKRLLALYEGLCLALKPGGVLITSFLTPPPSLSAQSPWKNFKQEDISKQKQIFADIINAKWQSYLLEKDMRALLAEAGLTVENVIYDKQGMFPTVVAKKNN